MKDRIKPPLPKDWSHDCINGVLYAFANLFISIIYILFFFNSGTYIDNANIIDISFEGASVALALFMYIVVSFVNINNSIKLPFLGGLVLFQNGRATDAMNELVISNLESWMILGDALALSGEILIVYAATKWVMQAYYISMTDKLTHLYNRHFLEQAFDKLLFLRRRGTPDIALIMLDLDDFKKINDNYGHGIGDDVLKVIARIILCNTRKTDIVARYGGEEFEVLLPSTNINMAKIFAERICDALASHNQSLLPKFTASIGVALYHKGDTIKSLRKRADSAVYEAKHRGKNQAIIAMYSGDFLPKRNKEGKIEGSVMECS